MTEVLDAPPKLGRGRPRPQETISRDELIFELLTEAKTREQLVAETGIAKQLVYLSLYRLRRDDRIKRVRESGVHRWTRL